MTRQTPNRVAVTNTDEGLRVWRRNALIAFTDENGDAWLLVEGEPRRHIGSADSERELRELLSGAGVRL